MSRNNTILLVLTGFLMLLIFVIFNDSEDISNPSETQSLIQTQCSSCPKINPEEDTVQFAFRLMTFLAERIDNGNWKCPLTDTCYRVPIEEMNLDEYLSSFENDQAVAHCGLTSRIMVKALLENGISAYTYNFGFKNNGNTHVVVLVRHLDSLIIFDPSYNYMAQDMAGNPLDLFSLLKMIKNKTVNIAMKSDSVVADMLISIPDMDESQVELLDSEVFNRYFINKTPLNDTLIKYQYYRCYDCAIEHYRFNSIRSFEERIKSETSLSSFEEGIVMKLCPIEGASDAKQLDHRIDSMLLSTNIEIWKNS